VIASGPARAFSRAPATGGVTSSPDDVGWEEQWSGRDGIREHYEELLGAFPDMDIKYERTHVTDEYVILEVVVTGTQNGREVPPLGRKMRSRVCALYTFDEEGLLNMERTYYDKAIILEQLGMFQDPRKPMGRVMAVITPPFAVVRAYLRKLLQRR
jgi:predicted ester cyclase